MHQQPGNFQPFQRPPKAPWYKGIPWWTWVIIGLFVIGAIGAVANPKAATTTSNVNQASLVGSAATQTPVYIVVTATPAPAVATIPATPTPVPPTSTLLPFTATPISTLASTATKVPAQPTNTTALNPTNTVVATSIKLPALNSRGVGLTKAEWEAINGKPSPEYSNDGETSVAYKGNNFLVSYIEGKIWSITIQFEQTPMSLSDAKALALTYMPSDVKYIKKYTDNIVGTVYVYKSQSIIPRFHSSDFPWNKPNTQGQILVDYTLDSSNPNKVIDLEVFASSEEDIGN